MDISRFIQKLENKEMLSAKEFTMLISSQLDEPDSRLLAASRRVTDLNYGKKVFFRGLIEMTNVCKNNCYYCGIRHDNKNVKRYHLSDAEILQCCESGYEMGLRTFVLQGGEDPRDTKEKLSNLVREIKKRYPKCAVTLSLGEKSLEEYEELKRAGADRYLLRHETATDSHYEYLHPKGMKLSTRMKCLRELRNLGFQVGAGFMVGSPLQSPEHLANDLIFLQEFKPHMVGIGPFIPQADTPFASSHAGSMNSTLTMIALTRLILPKALIPSTTALATIDPKGRTSGLRAGANVIMPNLSPAHLREDYALYDNKVTLGLDALEGLNELINSLKEEGFEPAISERGDHLDF